MGHQTRTCETEIDEEDNGKCFEDLLYGPTLKASPLKRVRLAGQLAKPHYNTITSTAKSTPHMTDSCQNTPDTPLSHRKPRTPPLSCNPPDTHSNPITPNPTYPADSKPQHSLNVYLPPHAIRQSILLEKQTQGTSGKAHVIINSNQGPPLYTSKTKPLSESPIENFSPYTPTSILITQLKINPQPNQTHQPPTPPTKPDKISKWTRYAHPLNIPMAAALPTQTTAKKRHSREEESVESELHDVDIELVQKRLKGTLLQEITPSNALSAEIASKQSRRAQ